MGKILGKRTGKGGRKSDKNFGIKNRRLAKHRNTPVTAEELERMKAQFLASGGEVMKIVLKKGDLK